jgi:hypothetical protein
LRRLRRDAHLLAGYLLNALRAVAFYLHVHDLSRGKKREGAEHVVP